VASRGVRGDTQRETLDPRRPRPELLMADAAMLMLMRAALGHELAGRRRGPTSL
jgi:hypothetical protein